MTSSPVVSVRGTATLEVEPELAELTVSIEAQAADQAGATELLSRRSAELAAVLDRFSAGIERSETSRLHVYPHLHSKKTERVRRYVASVTTSLAIADFAVLSDLVVAVSAVELASVEGPWWRLRSDSDAYRQARLAAARDALRRARDYAGAFGATVSELVELADLGMSLQHAGTARPQPAFAPAALTSGGFEPELALEPGRQQVSGSVEARFLISAPDLSV